MKKAFPLQAVGKDDARVRDKIRHEVNKYVRRSRKREIPEGFGMWEFACKIGPQAEQAESKPLDAIAHEIDAIAETGVKEVYIEIEAVPAQLKRR
ncbi:DUF6172 family protein [Oleiharenicola lentus]|uniref:DUF6172 family protein n=1 Tax=Oleiharenicola lentus TaxID=2508720 RepID=UPI003F6715FB